MPNVGNYHLQMKTAGTLLFLFLSVGFLLVTSLGVSSVHADGIKTSTDPLTVVETSTPTPLPTDTPTVTPTPSVLTDTATATPTPAETLTPTPIPTDTPTATPIPSEAPTETATATPTPTLTATPVATDTPSPAPLSAADVSIAALAVPGDVVINEAVTDPQQDWSTNGFNGIAGSGPVNDADEFIELYIKTNDLDLTGWTIELLDSSPITGTLVTGGAFQVSRCFCTGSFTNTVTGDYLILGDVKATGNAMNNSIWIVLKDSMGTIIDKVELGNDLENDGTADGAPDGTSRGGNAASAADEAVARFPNGTDTNNDVVDFIARSVTMGSSNDDGIGSPPLPGSVVINEVAWGGTLANSSDEWIELLNVTTQTITLTGWTITSTGGLNIALSGIISSNSYYLIERTNDGVITDTAAELTTSFGSGLSNSGTALFLSTGGTVIDTANNDGGPWFRGTGSPDYRSMERINPLAPDTDSNWDSNDLIHRNGLARDGLSLINGTPKQANSTTYPPPLPTPPPPILIGEFLYDGLTPSTEGDEFVELCNPNMTSVNLAGYKVGDEEMEGGGESMYKLPLTATLATNACLVIAKNATQFQARFGFLPDFAVADLSKHTAWGSGSWSLANDGDEVVLLGPNDEILDSVAYRNGDYTSLGLESDASAPEPYSLQRVWPTDTNSMPHDFVRADANPGLPTMPPAPPAAPPPAAALPDGMYAYWGDLHAHTTYSDGSGPPYYALAVARAAGLHFQALTDHDWWLTPLEWAKILTQTVNATVPGQFVALRGVEWTHAEAGHINVFNTDVLLNSRTDPTFNTLAAFYNWLATNPSAIAQFNHPDPSYDGNFYNFTYHPAAAQVMFMQEIGNKAQGYVTYEPSFVQSNTVGWKVAPTNNSDTHAADWGSHSAARTGLVAPALTESDLLAAMRARRVFATEDSNLAVALQVNGVWMGSSLATTGPLPLTVNMVDPDPEPLTLLLYDGNLPLATVSLATSTGQWTTTVTALPGHFFWAKVVQADGNAAYTAPVWIEGQAPRTRSSSMKFCLRPKIGTGTAMVRLITRTSGLSYIILPIAPLAWGAGSWWIAPGRLITFLWDKLFRPRALLFSTTPVPFLRSTMIPRQLVSFTLMVRLLTRLVTSTRRAMMKATVVYPMRALPGATIAVHRPRPPTGRKPQPAR